MSLSIGVVLVWLSRGLVEFSAKCMTWWGCMTASAEEVGLCVSVKRARCQMVGHGIGETSLSPHEGMTMCDYEVACSLI